GADEEISDGGILRVIVLGYDGLLMHPVALPSPDYIPRPKDPQAPPVPQDEDEREPMFIQAHDPDYVLEPIYPEYIPLEDKHELPAESDPKEDPEEYEDDETEDGPVDYPMDGGDDGEDDDGDSSRYDTDDEDEEEEEHLAPADSAVVVPIDKPVSPYEGTEPVIPPPSIDITIGARITVRPQASISLPSDAEVKRLLAMTTPLPSPLISLSPPFVGEHLARCMALPAHSSPPPVPSPLLPLSGFTAALPSPLLPPLPPSLYIPPPVDRRDAIPESEQPPRKRLCLSTLGSRYEIGESSTTRPTRDQGVDYGFVSIVDAEARRVTELAELHEHDTQDLYALLEDAQDSRSRISQRVDMDSQQVDLLMGDRVTLRETIWMVEEAYASQEAWAHSIGLSQAAHQELQTHHDHTKLLALRGQQRARQQTPNARIPDHQDALGDADSHV
ncbi:hypothetical protein Tco_1276951, partial [Tanacetum coccineum]